MLFAYDNNYSKEEFSFELIINGRCLEGLEGLTYTLHREPPPIYTMGIPNPRAFMRGKRSFHVNLKHNGELRFEIDVDQRIDDLEITIHKAGKPEYIFTASHLLCYQWTPNDMDLRTEEAFDLIKVPQTNLLALQFLRRN